MKTFLAFLVLSSTAYGQSSLTVPWVGHALFPTGDASQQAAGTLRTVRGVAGNFLVGDIELEGVLSSACNARVCLAKTSDAIWTRKVQPDATWTLASSPGSIAPGSTIFALGRDADGNDSAWIYFSDSGDFARWENSMVITQEIGPVHGQILSIRMRQTRLELAVRHAQQTWIVTSDAGIVDSLPSTAGPLLLLEDGAVYVSVGTESPDEIRIRRQDAHEVRLTMAGVASITSVGPHYAQIVTTEGLYLLRTDPGREQLFLMPEREANEIIERRKPETPGSNRRVLAEGTQP